MIKFEKCKLNILIVIIRTSIKSHKICLLVVLTKQNAIQQLPIKACKYKVWMLELLCNSLEMLKKAVDFTW